MGKKNRRKKKQSNFSTEKSNKKKKIQSLDRLLLKHPLPIMQSEQDDHVHQYHTRSKAIAKKLLGVSSGTPATFATVIERMSAEYSSDAPLFWIHLGSMSDKSFIDRVMSAIIVEDYIYRVVMEGSNAPQLRILPPFSTIMTKECTPVVINKTERIRIGLFYKCLLSVLAGEYCVKLEAYDTVRKKWNIGRIIMTKFARLCIDNNMTKGKINLMLPFIKSKTHVLVSMLEETTRFDLETQFLQNKTLSRLVTYENFIDHTGVNQTSKRKRANGRSKTNTKKNALLSKSKNNTCRLQTKKPHPGHRSEDCGIEKPASLPNIEKPGSLKGNDRVDLAKEGIRLNCASPIYSGKTKKHDFLPEYPVVVIETFRNREGEIKKGIVNETEKKYEPGKAAYMPFNKVKDKHLSEVIICETSSSYFYVFASADQRPHFVLTKREARKYQHALIDHDISTHTFRGKLLDEPLKLLSNHSISEGLRSGQYQESDFYFISNRTELFKRFFSDGLIKINLDYWMVEFDKLGRQCDELRRGFVSYVDIGWTREGAISSTENSQTQSADTLCAKPSILGEDEYFRQLGNLPDLIMAITDKVVFDNETKLMWDEERDNKFARILREKMNCNLARFEAYTLVRQPICKLGDESNIDFSGTARHIDGPNDRRVGYKHTCVFSLLCSWKKVSFNMYVIFLFQFMSDFIFFLTDGLQGITNLLHTSLGWKLD